MTVAATNETDVGAILKKIDSKNRIRFEKPAPKKTKTTVTKTIKKEAETQS